MKKICSLIIFLTISTFVFSHTVNAETFEIAENISVEYDEKIMELYVHGEGEVPPNALSKVPDIKRKVKKIVFDDGITSIGSGFLKTYSYGTIEEIVFPDSLKLIKQDAFYPISTNIKKLDIPDDTVVERRGIRDVRIEKLYTSNIKDSMHIVESCLSVRNIVFKDSLTHIPDGVKLPQGTLLYAVSFPSTVKYMPDDYFEGRVVTKVYGYTGTVVEKVTKDAGIPFYSLGNVNSTVKEGTEFWDNNIKYRTVGSETAIVVAVARSKKTHRVPDTVEYKGIDFKVTGIGNNALKGNKNVTSFVGNRNIATIGKRAFEGCPKLNYVNLGTATAVKTIKYAAFRDCKSLAKITIPNKVSVIETSAFNGCKKLKEVKFAGNKVTTIGTYAFNGVVSNVIFDVPNNKLYEYKKLFKGLKYPKGAKFI